MFRGSLDETLQHEDAIQVIINRSWIWVSYCGNLLFFFLNVSWILGALMLSHTWGRHLAKKYFIFGKSFFLF